MFKIFKNKRAQSTAEYAILIALVVGAVVAMQTYVKRGIQARQKVESDAYLGGLKTNFLAADQIVVGVNGDKGINPAIVPIMNSQYEFEKTASQSSQVVLEDTQTSNMTKEGVVTRNATTITKQEAGDYQQQNYTAP